MLHLKWIILTLVILISTILMPTILIMITLFPWILLKNRILNYSSKKILKLKKEENFPKTQLLLIMKIQLIILTQLMPMAKKMLLVQILLKILTKISCKLIKKWDPSRGLTLTSDIFVVPILLIPLKKIPLIIQTVLMMVQITDLEEEEPSPP